MKIKKIFYVVFLMYWSLLFHFSQICTKTNSIFLHFTFNWIQPYELLEFLENFWISLRFSQQIGKYPIRDSFSLKTPESCHKWVPFLINSISLKINITRRRYTFLAVFSKLVSHRMESFIMTAYVYIKVSLFSVEYIRLNDKKKKNEDETQKCFFCLCSMQKRL